MTQCISSFLDVSRVHSPPNSNERLWVWEEVSLAWAWSSDPRAGVWVQLCLCLLLSHEQSPCNLRLLDCGSRRFGCIARFPRSSKLWWCSLEVTQLIQLFLFVFLFWGHSNPKACWDVWGPCTARSQGWFSGPHPTTPLKAPSEHFVFVLIFHLRSLNDDLSGFQNRRLKGLIVCVASGVV